MKFLIILALLVSTTLAEEVTNEMDIDPANFNQMNMIHRMRYSMMGYNMAPPQEAIQHYNSINDEDFPIDYSLSCSNSCNCKTVCIMYWWIPCTCACPPPCNNNQNNNQNNQNNQFPPIEWQPETQAPRFPNFPNIGRTTTTTPSPIWNRPQIPPRWPSPEWIDPNNPGNHLTHPPQIQPPATPTPIQPPIWINPNPNPWNPRNPGNHLTHPPQVRTTAAPPVWWMNPNNPIQRPNNPIQRPNVPRPEPIPDPNPPNWWEQQPQQPSPPNWWDQQPNPNPPNWWDQQPQQPNPNPPNNWWQQPLPIEEPCDESCSCVPCTIIWVCPPACSASCCAARGFANSEKAEEIEEENKN